MVQVSASFRKTRVKITEYQWKKGFCDDVMGYV